MGPLSGAIGTLDARLPQATAGRPLFALIQSRKRGAGPNPATPQATAPLDQTVAGFGLAASNP